MTLHFIRHRLASAYLLFEYSVLTVLLSRSRWAILFLKFRKLSNTYLLPKINSSVLGLILTIFLYVFICNILIIFKSRLVSVLMFKIMMVLLSSLPLTKKFLCSLAYYLNILSSFTNQWNNVFVVKFKISILWLIKRCLTNLKCALIHDKWNFVIRLVYY